MGTPVSVNFGFLERHDGRLVALAGQAERYFSEDPNTAGLKLRQFGEVLAQLVASSANLPARREETQFDLINRLHADRLITPDVRQLFHDLRKGGNSANHDLEDSHREALQLLKFARHLGVWFHRTFGDTAFKPGPFVPPPDPAVESKALVDELLRLRAELTTHKLTAAQAKAVADEEKRQRLSAEALAKQNADDCKVWQDLAEEAEKKLSAAAKAVAPVIPEAVPELRLAAVVARAAEASAGLELDEADTRALIDADLRAVGWEADSKTLRFPDAKPQRGRNMAIAEWPTDKGPADYVLFSGLQVLGVIEAKRKSKDIPGSVEQARRYSEGFTVLGDEVLPGGPWKKHKLPFLFATNGRPYLEQLKTKSGIWFHDVRVGTNHPRPLLGWYSPEGLKGLLRQDIPAAEEKLRQEPMDRLGLREYQLDAIRAVEGALAHGKRTCLVAMATGTGKTRTCIGLLYRLVEARRFRRVLFLVDREALGTQAKEDFETDFIDGLNTFAKVFNVEGLEAMAPQPETRLHFATVQSMVKRILFPSDERPAPAIDQYDCIVVDECHRGYTLDKELSDDELGFRSEADYISKYRRVVEYFDAVKVGLTATPALHTTQIFGDPVFTYSYRDAVIDRYLVDHEPPIRIETELSRKGIHWARGAKAQRVDRRTGQVDLIHLPDELDFEVDSFNTQVVTENFNRAVCEELTKHIDPRLPEKTLIFCATDAHADLVVHLLKKALDARYGALEDDLVMKITGATDDRKGALNKFKNASRPNIAVTVDYLSTGVDVPSICNIVFLRRVKSRILYEQMKGRATRLCDDINKEVFRIFDAVDLYATLEDVTSMKPVVVDPALTFAKLASLLAKAPAGKAKDELLEQLIAKLQRKSRRFVEGARAERFELAAGMPIRQLVEQLKGGTAKAAATWLEGHEAVLELLDAEAGPAQSWISTEDDAVAEVSRGYGQGRKRPQDYLDAFGAFVTENINRIPALVAVATKPRSLTRKDLKALEQLLAKEGFTEASLRTAHRELTNQDIAANILGFIRQRAIGDPLLPYSERVAGAVKQVLSSKAWTAPQRKWLELIGRQLDKNEVLDKAAFDAGAFKDKGGYQGINRAFDGKLDDVLGDLMDAVWKKTG